MTRQRHKPGKAYTASNFASLDGSGDEVTFKLAVAFVDAWHGGALAGVCRWPERASVSTLSGKRRGRTMNFAHRTIRFGARSVYDGAFTTNYNCHWIRYTEEAEIFKGGRFASWMIQKDRGLEAGRDVSTTRNG